VNLGASIYSKVAKKLRGRGLRKYKFLNDFNQKIQAGVKSDFAVVQESKMYLGVRDHYNLSIDGFYEPKETELVKREVKKGNIVIDVGASIGYYTLLLSRLVGNSGKVFAFEPFENRIEILKQNIDINDYSNITIEKKIISDKIGSINLNEKNFNSTTLDDYFKNRKIDFIKVDVDGFEKKVTDGMLRVLENNQNIKLMMEYYPPGLEKFSGNPTDFPKKLELFGFEIFDIPQNMKKVVADDLAKMYPNSQNEYTNLFFLRP